VSASCQLIPQVSRKDNVRLGGENDDDATATRRGNVDRSGVEWVDADVKNSLIKLLLIGDSGECLGVIWDNECGKLSLVV
jgi:hypothetical protein